MTEQTSQAAGPRFCSNCGAAISASGASAPVAAHPPERLARLIGGAAILMLVAFVAGQFTGRQSATGANPAEQAGAAVPLSATAAAPDISSMSPEERGSRLFNRVMLYNEQGKTDSARFFAPMAIQAIEMIGPPDAHARYDIGVISAAVGDAARARQEATAILAARPNHLLGLVLAIRAAELSGDASAVARHRGRLVAAAPTERATALKEYEEHARDIDEALKKANTSPR